MARQLTIATLNIHRDIQSKYQQLQKLIIANNISILLLQEVNQISMNTKQQIETTWGGEVIVNAGKIRSAGTAT